PQRARPAGPQELHAQVGGEERLVPVEHRPAGAAHRRVQQRGDQPALHDRSAGGREAVLLRGVPLDAGPARGPAEPTVSQGAPGVGAGAAGVLPGVHVGEPLARLDRPVAGPGHQSPAWWPRCPAAPAPAGPAPWASGWPVGWLSPWPPGPVAARVRSRLRSTLPTLVSGMASSTCTSRGYLVAARRVLAWATRSAGAAAVPGRSATYATTSSPSRGSGRPTTAAIATAGWASSTSSTSRGNTLKPPRMIRSFFRSTTYR